MDTLLNEETREKRYGLFNDATDIRLEVSTVCQLRCPVCLSWGNEYLGKGHLRFEDFRRFVEQNPSFRNYELSNKGEIFLNPELIDIIRYAHERGLRLTTWNGVNLNTVSDEVLEALVRYRFKIILVSIDGASQETYSVYRRGGDFQRVIENIKKINAYKAQYGSQEPELFWKFIAFGHNEKEIPLARAMAHSLCMNFGVSFNVDPRYSPVRDRAFVAKEMGLSSDHDYDDVLARESMTACRQMFLSPQINWDGRLLGCCVNNRSDYGNVFREGLAACLSSPRYLYARAMLTGEKPASPDIPCASCHIYRWRAEREEFLHEYRE